MANPSLLGSFAGSSTNKVAPSAGLQLNGYSFEEILASGNYNYMIEQLYAASNKSKYDGFWDWESGTYELGALVKHIGSTWESTTASNTSEPGIANWKPYVYKAEVTHDIVIGEVTAGSATIILTPSENASKRIIITDSGTLTSVAGELLISSDIRDLIVVNNDNVDLKVWRDNGAGVGAGGFALISAGQSATLYCDGTNVEFMQISGTVIGGVTIIDTTDTSDATLTNLSTTYVTKESSTKSKLIVRLVIPTALSTSTTAPANWCAGLVQVKEDTIAKIDARYGGMNTANAYGSVVGEYTKVNHTKAQSIAYTTNIAGISASSLTNTAKGTISPITFEIQEVLL